MDLDDAGDMTTRTDAGYIPSNVVEGFGTDLSNPLPGILNFQSLTEGWVSFTVRRALGLSGDQPFIVLKDSITGRTLLDVGRGPGSTPDLEFRYFDETGTVVSQRLNDVWVATGINRMDIGVRIAEESGALSFYINGSLTHTFPITPADLYATSFNQVVFNGSLSTGSVSARTSVFTAAMVSTEDTRSAEFYQRKPAGAGDLTDWTGSYTDIDEIGLDVESFVSGQSDGDRSSYTTTDLSAVIADGKEIYAVVHSVTAIRNVPGVGQLSTIVRENSNNHDSDPKSPGETWTNLQFIQDINPLTGNPFTKGEVATSQMGLLVSI